MEESFVYNFVWYELEHIRFSLHPAQQDAWVGMFATHSLYGRWETAVLNMSGRLGRLGSIAVWGEHCREKWRGDLVVICFQSGGGVLSICQRGAPSAVASCAADSSCSAALSSSATSARLCCASTRAGIASTSSIWCRASKLTPRETWPRLLRVPAKSGPISWKVLKSFHV